MEKYMIIDGNRVAFDKEKNILQVIKKAGIHVPTLCYYSELSIYGSCRMCVVEDNRGGIFASCSATPKDRMEIKTNSPRLYQYRKMILELLLSSHCRDCTICEKNGKCRLQLLAARFGLTKIRFKNSKSESKDIDDSSHAIIRDPSKCILCGACVRMCNEIQHVGAIDLAYRGAKMLVTPAFGNNLDATDCVNCGQCAAVCPTSAITIKIDSGEVWQAIYNPKKRVVVQVAPAVRVALGEEFGLAAGENSIGKIFTAIRMLGFDAVFDTSTSADITVIEEAEELANKLEHPEKYPKGNEWPLFTSCCPGWIRFVETKHPEMLPYISTCKSPMEMFGVILKEHYKEMDKEENKETISVAVMPCVAKKYEAAREEFVREGVPDVDYVITTTELIRMIKEVGIQFNEIEPEAPDAPFSFYSGAGVIFGATGGVTEAALRRVVEDKTTKALKEISFSGVRGMEGVKIAEIPFKDTNLRIAVVSGLGNADSLIEKIKSGEEHFDFVEVMACPNGCIAGAGQPFSHTKEKKKRLAGMYLADKASLIKRSEENPVIQSLYHGGLLEGRSHELLHVEYKNQKE